MDNGPSALDNPSLGATSVYRVVVEAFPELGEQDSVDGLKRDLFRCFYQTRPPRIKTSMSCDWHSDVKIMLDMPILQEIRHLTTRNATMSLFATISALESIQLWHQMDSINPEDIQEYQSGQGGRLLNDLAGLKEMDELVESMELSENDSEDPAAGAQGGGHGEGDGDSTYTTDFSVRLRLLNMIRSNDTYKEIFKIFGRFKRVVSEIRKEDIFTGSGCSSLDLGNEIDRVPVNEIIKPTELLAKDLANDEALQMADDTDEAPGEGPLAIMVDHSGSMFCASEHIQGASRQDIAIGIVLALQEVCQSQNRDMYISFFDNCVNYRFFCKRGVIKVEDLYKMISITPSGGTNFKEPVVDMIAWLKDYERADKTDVILLTDGCAGEHTDTAGLERYNLSVNSNTKFNISSQDGEYHRGSHSSEDFWAWTRMELDKYGSRFWILQIGDYMDNLMLEVSDKCFTGLDDPNQADTSYKSILREMVEAKKPKWLRSSK